MSDNLALWHKVEKTPSEHTKAISGKSYKGTSPKPHWIIQKATETFGPCGIGWGFTVEERVENGAMIEAGFFERMHIAKVRVWYKWDGERGEIEHIGGTPFSGRYSSGKSYTDEDAPKKSVTDALVKALSMIGFAGDIFMGRYDDSKYVSELREEEREAKREAAKPIAATKAVASNDDPFSEPAPKPATNITPISERARATAPRQVDTKPAVPVSNTVADYIIAFETKVRFCENMQDLDKSWTEEAKNRAQIGIAKDSDAYKRLADIARARKDEIGAEVAKNLRAG